MLGGNRSLSPQHIEKYAFNSLFGLSRISEGPAHRQFSGVKFRGEHSAVFGLATGTAVLSEKPREPEKRGRSGLLLARRKAAANHVLAQDLCTDTGTSR